MKLKEIYRMAVEAGIDADPRGREAVEKGLARAKEQYDSMQEDERAFFDVEKLSNPYSDTRIFNGTGEEEIEGLIVGVDMEVPEVLLADRLRSMGRKIDLVLTHHPEGKGLAELSEVMKMQADMWGMQGVPINVGDPLIASRAKEVYTRLSPFNHYRSIDAARLLDIPFLGVHTPTDNLVQGWLQAHIDKNPPERVKELVKMLKGVPEYAEATRRGAGPFQTVGNGETRCGRIVVEMTGGTGGPKEAIEKLAQAGVGTLVGMHMDEKVKEEAEKHKINVVIAGHIASDSIGINIFLDKLEERGVEITTCSGVIRVNRDK